MAKKAAIACLASLGIAWGLWKCLSSVPWLSWAQTPYASRVQNPYHHAPGWKLEVVAEAPRVVYPTAITVAPDGRVFVGQDPIDMAGPADQPIDSIVCIHPNGRITVFATNLHCVFGLQYLDGKLYVNHAPKCSVFTDRNGVGTDRVDLFDYTNPRQLLAGSVTHIPAGIRWAMDGFIYMSVGDAGIYRAVGKDGRMLSMQGGGVIRFRPDGTELEIYSTGTRNHPDLAINAEGEIFTYDNTDDGLGWWTRVTHMVDGGFYGYPWDYLPRRPYTLWMMGDYGGGAGTAAFSYSEDALPAEFQGNLFLGDFARSQLLRLRVEREGATYRILHREMQGDLDFVTGGTNEFRPIGVAASPDGMSLYITDWNTPLAGDKAVTGRLLKLTYTGESQAVPRPAWLAQAGTGHDVKASTDELLAALRHPATSVRLIAQRRLAARGSEAGPALIKLLEDSSAPAPARWSAIWGLDAWDRGVGGRKTIIAALTDREASVRRQAARQLGTRKASEAVTHLIGLLKDSDASVRFQGATALGRVGALAAVPALLDALVETDMFARYAAFTALNRIGQAQPQAWKQITAGLSSPNTRIREGVVFALRETYSTELVSLLCAYAADPANSVDTRAAVLDALGEMARLPAEWKGDWWGATGFNPASRPRPAKTQDWEATLAATAALRKALTDSQPLVRRAGVVGLRRCHDVAVCELLHELVCRETELSVSKEILATLGELKDPHFGDLLSGMITNAVRYGPLLPNAVAAAEQVENDSVTTPLTDLLDAKLGEQLQILSIQALVKLMAESAVPAIARCIDERNSNIWRSAVRALGQIGSDSAATMLAHKLTDHRPHVRQAVVDALGKLRNPAAVPALIAACQNEASRPAAVSVLTRIPDVRALEVYLDGLQSDDELVQKMCLKALGAIQMEALPLLEERMTRERKELIPPQFIPVLQNFGGGFNLREWQCLGPLNEPSLDGRLDAGSVVMNTKLVDRSGKVHRWHHVVGKPLSGHVKLYDWLDDRTIQTNCFIYLAARFTRPEEQEMELAAVCPDVSGLALWLNGRSLSTFADSKQRIYRAAVTVKQGENDLLARIQNPHAVTQFGVNIAPARVRSAVPSAVQPPKDAYAAWALNNHGNAARGRNRFSEPSGGGCIRCHRVNGEGGTIGPDLSSVGSKYNRAQLIETILYPSRQILSGYRQTVITTKEGESTTGLVQREDNVTITLLDTSGQEHTIKKSLIAHRELSAVSPMPDGLYAGWSRRDFGDVIAFLDGLKTPQQAKLR